MGNEKPRQSRWRRWGKRAGIFLLIMAGILLIIQILFSYFAESYLRQQIESSISESGNFHAEVGNLQLSTLKRQIRINDINIYPNAGKTTGSVDSLIIEDITFNGLQIFSYVWGDKLALDYISINNSKIFAVNSATKSTESNQEKSFNETVYEGLKSYAKSVDIDNFLITGLIATLRDSTADTPFVTANDMYLHFSNIRIDSAWAEQNSVLPSTNFHGSLDSLKWTLSSGLYDFRINDLHFSSQDSSVRSERISLVPRHPKYEFAKSVGHEIDRIDLDIGETELVDIDLPALVEDSALIASALHIRDSRIEVFHDKKQPADEVEDKIFPHVKLWQIKQQIRLDSIIVSNADIIYSEHLNRVPEPGYISFENTHAAIRNVYSNGGNSPLTMDVNSEIMGKGQLVADFEFAVSKKDSHTVAGRIDSMSVESLNPALKYLGLVEASSGQIHSIDFQMNMGPKQATGDMFMFYSDLKIDVIKYDDTGDENSAGLKSFLANTFVIKENNKPPLREGKISHERLPDKSIFNYWWKSLLSGLKSSVGL